MVKICFIDRDGVINKLVPREGMTACAPWTLEQFEFQPKVHEAIKNIKHKGFVTIVATNQPDVRDGFMTWDSLNAIHNKIQNELEIDEIFMAHERGDPSYKPNPGMLLRGIENHYADPSQCYMIGDTDKDVIAGHRAGINTIWVNDEWVNGKEWNLKKDHKNTYGDIKPDYITDSLWRASFLI